MKVSDWFVEGELGIWGDVWCGTLDMLFRDMPIKGRGVKCGEMSNGGHPLSGIAPCPFQCLHMMEHATDSDFDLSDGRFGKVVPWAMWDNLLLLDVILAAHFTESSMDFFGCIVRD